MFLLAALTLAALAAVAVWWRFFRIARPVVPPLEIADDDPRMCDAMETAKRTLPRFRALVAEPHRSAHLKVRFVSNSGQTEYLWAELRELRATDVEVLYLTPPVTHTGRLERVHTHPLSDVMDWTVESPRGMCEGGFTMRVMFAHAREQWGELPPELAAEERRYLTGEPTR